MRKRSSTVSSAPVAFGQSKVTPYWIHDQNFHLGDIIINTSIWPGLGRGDLIQVVPAGGVSHSGARFLFFVDEGTTNNSKTQVSHVSISREVSQKFGFAQNKSVKLTKIDPATVHANALEIHFRDTYMCRREMYRITRLLDSKTVYVGQKVAAYLASGAIIKDIHVNGRSCTAAVVTPKTRTIFRSLTARCSIFISVCRELWEFSSDGERYYEKIVHSFFPALIAKWREYSSKHLTSIVLFSRAFYEEGELQYAAGPLKQDDEGRWYKDFYKVVLDLEVVRDWKPVLVDLKESFFTFQRDILFNHHYHQHQRKILRASLPPSGHSNASPMSKPPALSCSLSENFSVTGNAEFPDHCRLVGSLSYAYTSPLLEAINLSLTPQTTSQADRSLSLTGLSTIIITPPSSSSAPSSCSFRVNRNMLKFTTERLVDAGLAVDLVTLGKKPPGRAPILGWKAKEGEGSLGFGKGIDAVGGLIGGIGPGLHAGLGVLSSDQVPSSSPPNLGGKALEDNDADMRMYFWEPFWMTVSFWDIQADQPFRTDRFIPLARMPEIQSLGLLDHGVSNTIKISIPYTSNPTEGNPAYLHCAGYKAPSHPDVSSLVTGLCERKAARDQFDRDVFVKRAPVDVPTRSSLTLARQSSSTVVPDWMDKQIGTPSDGTRPHSVKVANDPDATQIRPNSSSVPQAGETSDTLPSEQNVLRAESLSLAPSAISPKSLKDKMALPINENKNNSPHVPFDPISPALETTGGRIHAEGLSEAHNSSIRPAVNSTNRGSKHKSRSPSRESVRSALSSVSHISSTPSKRRATMVKMTPSRFSSAPGSWLLTHFRSDISAPQASTVSANKDRTMPVPASSPNQSAAQEADLPTVTETCDIGHAISLETESTGTASLGEVRKEGAWPSSSVPPLIQDGLRFVGPASNVQNEHGNDPAVSRTNRGPDHTEPQPSGLGLSTLPGSVTPETAARRPSMSNRRAYSHTRTLSSIVRENEQHVQSSGFFRRMPRPNSTQNVVNASRLGVTLLPSQKMMARQWQHVFPSPTFTRDVKWKSMCAPACLPITTEYHPSKADVNQNFIQHTYDVFLAREASGSILLRKDPSQPSSEWPLLVMRTMVHARMIQGFQLIVGEPNIRQKYIPEVEEIMLMPASLPLGVADSMINLNEAVYVSMGDHVHRITYEAEEDLIRVRRIMRKAIEPAIRLINYDCLVWPKLGEGYTEARAVFATSELDTYGWNRLDLTITGYQREFSDVVRHCQTRYLVIPSEHPPSDMYGESGERLSDEECRLLGSDRLAELFGKARWLAHGETLDQFTPPRFLYTWLDPPSSVLDTSLMETLDDLNATAAIGRPRHVDRSLEGMSLSAIAKAMREEKGLIRDRHWNRKFYPDSFTGHEFVSWVLTTFCDFSTREQATEWGGSLVGKGLFHHVRDKHPLMDGHYFYVFGHAYAAATAPPPSRWLFKLKRPSNEENDPSSVPAAGSQKPSRKRHTLSQTMVIDADQSKRSPFAESVVLHHDVIQNPGTAFHFELHWVTTSARCIEDLLQHWSWVIARHGLRLVEGYVDPIVDIGTKNIFQSCFPIPLALTPPSATSLDLHLRFVEGSSLRWFFEYAILRKFGYILDVEAGSSYSDTVDVWYSYRRASFKQSQFIHRTGLAFVQVMGGEAGFQWITNRLLVTSSAAHAGKNASYSQADKTPHERANVHRLELLAFCSDVQALRDFYDDVISKLPPKGHVVETMSQPARHLSAPTDVISLVGGHLSLKSDSTVPS